MSTTDLKASQRGFAVLTKDDTKTKLTETKKEKAEDSDEIFSRVVAVQEEEIVDRFDEDDSWSDHTNAVGPTTTGN